MGDTWIEDSRVDETRIDDAIGVDGAARPHAQARVAVEARPLWQIRLVRELPRALLLAASCAGLAASARFAIAPPRPAAATASKQAAADASTQDLAAEGFAQLFARRYLTWEAQDPEAHQRALAPFVGTGMEAGAGLQPPATGRGAAAEEQVLWTEVAQERTAGVGEHVYTVAAQTDTAGLVYLAVSVERTADGALRMVGYPAFVGAPATEPGSVDGGLREVADPALRTVVERALRNYLVGSGSELAADLTSAARVSLPAQPLVLEGVQRLDWSAEGGGAVSAIVQAQDARGTRYTLAYDLDVVRVAGRWEVAAIEMDPDS